MALYFVRLDFVVRSHCFERIFRAGPEIVSEKSGGRKLVQVFFDTDRRRFSARLGQAITMQVQFMAS